MHIPSRRQRAARLGNSLLEEDKIPYALEMMKKAEEKGVKFLTPVDTVIAKEFKNDTEYKTVPTGEIPDGWMSLDIGEETRKQFADAIKGAKTVVWNGPMGVFEFENFCKGHKGSCRSNGLYRCNHNHRAAVILRRQLISWAMAIK